MTEGIQQKDMENIEGNRKNYSKVMKNKKEERIVIKPKIDQESEETKKIIKEKVDIKSLLLDITKVKKGSKGAIILGCETEREIKKIDRIERIERLKETVQDKLGEKYETTELKKKKPRLKIINIGEEIMKLQDEDIIETIERQNEIKEMEGVFHIGIVKRIVKRGRQSERRAGGGRGEEGSLIVEMDKLTYE